MRRLGRASGEFVAEGEPARGIEYRARIESGASESDLRDLRQAMDRVIEIRRTLRAATPVRMALAEGRA